MSPDMTASTGLMMMMNAGSGGGLLTPSLSVGSSVVMSLSPSLKSRESAVSVGGGGLESDQSYGPVNATAGNGGEQGLRVHVGDESSGGGGMNVSGGGAGGGGEKTKATNKLKKYKEGAEKVLMLFSSAGSPKQHHHAS